MQTVYKSVDAALIHPRIGTSMSILLLLIFGVSCADAQPFAYVANNNDSTVSVINTATNAVVATIPVGLNPLAVAFTPDGSHAYVTNVGFVSKYLPGRNTPSGNLESFQRGQPKFYEHQYGLAGRDWRTKGEISRDRNRQRRNRVQF